MIRESSQDCGLQAGEVPVFWVTCVSMRARLCGQGRQGQDLQEGVRGSAQAGFLEEEAQHQPCSGAQKSVGRGEGGAPGE